MKKLILILIIASFSVSLLGAKLKIAVMDFEDKSGKFSEKELTTATEMFRGHLGASGKFIIIDKTRQAEKLKKLVRDGQKESYKECYDEKCQIPLGQALSADSIIRTSITCLGDTCTISSDLIDLAKVATTAAAIKKFDGTINGLVTSIEEVAGKLSGKEIKKETTALKSSTIRPYKWHGIGAFAVGALIFTGGLLADAKASSLYDDYNENKNIWDEKKKEEATSDQDDYILYSYIGYGAGAALMVTGTVLFFITEETPLENVSFYLNHEQVMIGYRFNF